LRHQKATKTNDFPHILKHLSRDIEKGFGAVITGIVNRQFQWATVFLNLSDRLIDRRFISHIGQQGSGAATGFNNICGNRLNLFSRAAIDENMQAARGGAMA
jgi:ABC-type uncharacterized transport system ATPase component